MAVDKSKLKPILDGQFGDEVATNMKGNFDYLADGINSLGSSFSISDKISAKALVEQASDIESLKKVLLQLISGDLYTDKTLTRSISIDGADLYLKRDATPSESPDFTGQFYIDQASKIAYISVGNESVSDWKPINKIN